MGLSERIAELEKLKSEALISEEEFKLLVSLAVQDVSGTQSFVASTVDIPEIETVSGIPEKVSETKNFVAAPAIISEVENSEAGIAKVQEGKSSIKSKKVGLIAVAAIILGVIAFKAMQPSIETSAQIDVGSTQVSDDSIIAPYAQMVCAALDDFGTPVQTTSEEVSFLNEATKQLNEQISATQNSTFEPVASLASEALIYEQRSAPDSARLRDSYSNESPVCEALGLDFRGIIKKLINPTDNAISTADDFNPTWITKTPEDLFVAPSAQAVCDILRTWMPPAVTTASEVSLLEKANSGLKGMLEGSKTLTYSEIYVLANAALEYERKYPNDDVFPLSYDSSQFQCDRFKFTAENSKYGIDPLTGNYKGN